MCWAQHRYTSIGTSGEPTEIGSGYDLLPEERVGRAELHDEELCNWHLLSDVIRMTKWGI